MRLTQLYPTTEGTQAVMVTPSFDLEDTKGRFQCVSFRHVSLIRPYSDTLSYLDMEVVIQYSSRQESFSIEYESKSYAYWDLISVPLDIDATGTANMSIIFTKRGNDDSYLPVTQIDDVMIERDSCKRKFINIVFLIVESLSAHYLKHIL